jgi:hypothetical protein
MKRLLRKTSPSMVVACLALAIALSGSAYAVAKLPRNSVGTAQLKANAVNSSKVANGSLKKLDFAPGQLPKGDPGDKGDKGDTGEKGDKGDTGDTGPPGPSAQRIDVSVNNGSQSDLAVVGNFTLRFVCSGDAAHRLFTLGVPAGSGGIQLSGIKSKSDTAASIVPFVAGAGLPSGQFVGIGVGQPDATNTSGFFYRMNGSFVLHNGLTVTSVTYDMFLENRANQGTCQFRGTAVQTGLIV